MGVVRTGVSTVVRQIFVYGPFISICFSVGVFVIVVVSSFYRDCVDCVSERVSVSRWFLEDLFSLDQEES